MIKITVDNWNSLIQCMERIKEVGLLSHVTINAEMIITDEILAGALFQKKENFNKLSQENCLEQSCEIREYRKKEGQKLEVLEKKIISYFQQNNNREIKTIEIEKKLELTRQQVQRAIRSLKSKNVIGKVRHGEYRLIQLRDKKTIETALQKDEQSLEKKNKIDNTEQQLPEDVMKLKFLYQREETKIIMDYIYTKSEITVDKAREKFYVREKELTEVIKFSREIGFIEEQEDRDAVKYKVKDIARIWHELSQRSGNVSSVIARLNFSTMRVNKSLKEGIKRQLISMNSHEIYTVT